MEDNYQYFWYAEGYNASDDFDTKEECIADIEKTFAQYPQCKEIGLYAYDRDKYPCGADLDECEYIEYYTPIQRKRQVISINGKNLHLILGKTEQEWMDKYGTTECWSIIIDELLDGTMEINEDIWYWLINGRCYETTEDII